MKIEIYSPTIRRKEMDSVLTAMVEEKIGPGERSRLLVQTAKEQLHFDYALALRSPAVAMFTALKAINTGDGQAAFDKAAFDKANVKKAAVISALSPRYYLQVLQDLDITPLYCDVSYDFPCMSRESIEDTIAKKPQELDVCAIVLHHTLGFTPDAASIAELGIPVIEDISQSYGSWLKPISKKDKQQDDSPPAPAGKTEKEEPAVKFGGVFCVLGLEERDMLTSGGGALLFAMNRKDGLLLRNFAGLADEYCLPDINSALAIVQFKELHRNITRRNEIAQVYIQAGLRTRHKRFIPTDGEYCNYSFSLVLETGLKDVAAYARKKEIEIENAFKNTIAGYAICDNCPVSSSLVMRTVLFPIYPRLRSQDVERVSRLIMTLP
jgi:dTDP-4-amino-4,6-dideoxygalactose transaminase